MQLENIRKLTHNKHILQYVLKRNRMQRGGKGKDQLVSPKYPEEIYVSYEDGKYVIKGEKLDNGDYMYSLATKNRRDQCVYIIIEPKRSLAYIGGISAHKDNQCINYDEKIGTSILKLTIKFLKENKKVFKINKITLNDDSHMACGNVSIFLAPMRTLQYGDTWYGKHGFLPHDDDHNVQDKVLTKMYERNKIIMENLKITDCYDNIKDIIKKAYREVNPENVDLKEILSRLKKMKKKNMLVMDFFKRFSIDFDNRCKLFYNMYLEFITEFQLYDFHGKNFFMDI